MLSFDPQTTAPEYRNQRPKRPKSAVRRPSASAMEGGPSLDDTRFAGPTSGLSAAVPLRFADVNRAGSRGIRNYRRVQFRPFADGCSASDARICHFSLWRGGRSRSLQGGQRRGARAPLRAFPCDAPARELAAPLLVAPSVQTLTLRVPPRPPSVRT